MEVEYKREFDFTYYEWVHQIYGRDNKDQLMVSELRTPPNKKSIGFSSMKYWASRFKRELNA